MFYFTVFLLSFFMSVDAMEIKSSKDWVSLKSLVCLEGYHAAKARGNRVTINKTPADMIQVLEKDNRFCDDIRKEIAHTLKRYIYAKKAIYKQYNPQFKGGYYCFDDESEACSLCIDEHNNKLFCAFRSGMVCELDFKIKAWKRSFNCCCDLHNMYISQQGALIAETTNGSFREYHPQKYLLVNEYFDNTEAKSSFNKNDCCKSVFPFHMDLDDFIYLPQSELKLLINIESIPKTMFYLFDFIVKDAHGNNLAPIKLKGVKRSFSCMAVDSRNDILYTGVGCNVVMLRPLFNCKQAMKQFDVLALAVVADGMTPQHNDCVVI